MKVNVLTYNMSWATQKNKAFEKIEEMVKQLTVQPKK